VTALPTPVAAVAARRAVTRCGPTIGTLAQYQIAVDRAAREVSRTSAIADRYWRRFRRKPVLVRLMIHREVALALYQQRAECVRLLTEPESASA
jgi:hypothetical protein